MQEPSTAATVQEIQAALAANDERSTDGFRRVRRQFSRQLKDQPPDFILPVAESLIALGPWLYRWFAYELIHFHRPTLRTLDAPALERLGAGMDDWKVTDTFAPFLAGVAWREGQIADEVVHRWARSEDRWWRRTALVCTIALNTKARGGFGDSRRTLEVCRLLVSDRDDMVVKGLSWALRALVPWDSAAVEAFLTQYEDVLAARVKREVRNKLRTGLKNPRS